MNETVPHTVVEASAFTARAVELLGESGRESLVDFLAMNPSAGKVVPDAGGVRKLRWPIPGEGKRGGARVIYYFHGPEHPVFALQLYSKNRKSDMTYEERRKLKLLLPVMIREYGRRSQ